MSDTMVHRAIVRHQSVSLSLVVERPCNISRSIVEIALRAAWMVSCTVATTTADPAVACRRLHYVSMTQDKPNWQRLPKTVTLSRDYTEWKKSMELFPSAVGARRASFNDTTPLFIVYRSIVHRPFSILGVRTIFKWNLQT